MAYQLNETHDSAARSWVESANAVGSDFPIQNLPLGVFDSGHTPRVGIAIGDRVLDIEECESAGLFDGAAEVASAACSEGALHYLMGMEPRYWSALRKATFHLLADGTKRDVRTRVETCLLPMESVQMLVPHIGDFTDFYASIDHATNVGSMFRPENPLLPNYKYVPIAYHGRASSIVASGTPVRRPMGQTREDPEQPPALGPSRRLDYEAEVGFFVGPGNALGRPIPIGEADQHLFGVCLVNDWSARDIQTWEYQPLGPFLSKSFATTISPWVVTMEALAPYRVPARPRPAGDPAPLPHLSDAADQEHGGLDLTVEVWLRTQRMREESVDAVRLSRGRFRDLYCTPAQMLAHHASNGCNLRPGDLLGSGTVSGPEKGARGCLLELTWKGAEPVELPTGEQRRFLEDGDEVVMRGACEGDGRPRIGFGECRGVVLPAE